MFFDKAKIYIEAEAITSKTFLVNRVAHNLAALEDDGAQVRRLNRSMFEFLEKVNEVQLHLQSEGLWYFSH